MQMAINQLPNLTVTLNNEQVKRELSELREEMKRLIDLRDRAQAACLIVGGVTKLSVAVEASLTKREPFLKWMIFNNR